MIHGRKIILSIFDCKSYEKIKQYQVIWRHLESIIDREAQRDSRFEDDNLILHRKVNIGGRKVNISNRHVARTLDP